MTSPGREPARLTRTRIASGDTRSRAERSPWSWTSTVSGRSLVTTSPEGTPSSSMGRGKVTLVFSELITNTHRVAEKARASSLSSQWCTSQARTTASLPQPVPRGLPPGLLGGHGRGLEREELGETVTEGVMVLWALEAPLHGEGDPARLLRHHEDDGVRLLAEPEGRAMPRPHGAPELRVARQRQEAARCGHAPGADEDGPVVQRRVREEEALQEIGRDEGIEGYTELSVVAQAGGPLQHHETADALGGQRLRRLHHLVEEMTLLLAPRARRGPEEPEVVEEPARAVELEAVGKERSGHEGAQPQEHLHGARLLEHDEDAVEHDGHEQDIDGIAHAEGLERRPHARPRPPRGAPPRPRARPVPSRPRRGLGSDGRRRARRRPLRPASRGGAERDRARPRSRR